MIKLLVGNSRTKDTSRLSISEMLYERISLFEARILWLIYGFQHSIQPNTNNLILVILGIPPQHIKVIYEKPIFSLDRTCKINYMCKKTAFKILGDIYIISQRS